MCFQKACFPFHPHFEKVETKSCCFCDTKMSFNSVANAKQESPVVTIRKLCTLEMLSSLCSRMVAVPVSSREHGAQNSRGRFGSQTAVNIVRKKKQDQRKTSLGSFRWKEVAFPKRRTCETARLKETMFWNYLQENDFKQFPCNSSSFVFSVVAFTNVPRMGWKVRPFLLKKWTKV